MTLGYLTPLRGKEQSQVRWRSVIRVDPKECTGIAAKRVLDALSEHWHAFVDAPMGHIHLLAKPNLVTSSGLHISGNRLFNIEGPPGPLITMGVDDGASNPVAGTSSSSAGSTNRRLVAFDSTPTRSGQVWSVSGTFTDAIVSFVVKRLLLSKASAGTTDSAGDLYAMTDVFTLDLGAAFSTWSQTIAADVTLTGS